MSDPILDRLRKICLSLPEAAETETWGHPNFRVAGKIFCAYEEYKGELSICCKVGKPMQGVYLQDPRFYMTPYVGKHGWVSLKVRAAKLKWPEITSLVKTSYGLVAPSKSAKR